VHRILIVEDSPTMLELLETALEELGQPIEITGAASGFEALRALPRARFDLILTDINMPDINGLELVSFVKQSPRYREIPLVIVSTESSPRDLEKGVRLGADAYVAKPFDPEALRELVRELLARSERAA
jgi:two-component system chemotaxis response regulator CheY